MVLLGVFSLVTACLASDQSQVKNLNTEEQGVRLSISEAGQEDRGIQAIAGEEVVLVILAEGTHEMAGMQFKLEYDNKMLEIAEGGVEPGDFPSNFLFQARPDNSRGVVDFTLASARPSELDRITVASLTFRVSGSPGNSATLRFKDALAGDGSVPPRPMQISGQSGQLAITESR